MSDEEDGMYETEDEETFVCDGCGEEISSRFKMVQEGKEYCMACRKDVEKRELSSHKKTKPQNSEEGGELSQPKFKKFTSEELKAVLDACWECENLDKVAERCKMTKKRANSAYQSLKKAGVPLPSFKEKKKEVFEDLKKYAEKFKKPKGAGPWNSK